MSSQETQNPEEDSEKPPADLQPQPVEVGLHPVVVNPQSIEINLQQLQLDPQPDPVELNPQPDEVGLQQVEVNPQPIEINLQQVHLDPQPDPVEFNLQPDEVGLQQVEVNPQPIEINLQQVHLDPQPDPVEFNPQPDEVGLHQVQVNPQPIEINPQQVELDPQPVEFGPQPVAFGSQLVELGSRPIELVSQPLELGYPLVELKPPQAKWEPPPKSEYIPPPTDFEPQPSTSSGKTSHEERRQAMKAMKARRKREMPQRPEANAAYSLVDPYANATASNYITRGDTALSYDTECLKHRCEWDIRYPESPQRMSFIVDKCIEKGLVTKCKILPVRVRHDLYQRIIRIHSTGHYEKLRRLSTSSTLPMMELESANYDAIYINRNTFDVACRCVAVVLNLVEAIAKGDVLNGLAIVRPPGHHAMYNAYNGYCFFNNVAIAAQMCLDNKYSKKILILDWDIHHGQGIQQAFYDTDEVLYISIHRYEHGTFWPHLPESNFNYTGRGRGAGYNINIPLNATGLGDDDYLAIFFSIILPVAYEFNPDLVIVAAGYDATVGCPEGKMNVTPGCYSHMTTLLSGLARGRMAVCLEGGYFLPTLSEGVAMTLKALIGGPCPMLDPIKNVHPSVIETISNVRRSLINKWNCFKFCETIPLTEVTDNGDQHKYRICYFGTPERPPYSTRNCYPENSPLEMAYYSKYNKALKEKYRASPSLPVYLAYDDRLLLHQPRTREIERPERPERLISIMKTFLDFGLDKRYVRIPIPILDFSNYSPHPRDYLDSIEAMDQTTDIYTNEFTTETIQVAVSALMTLIDNIMTGYCRSGVAVIRPPGHHAEYHKASGFCFVNNIAIAANYLLRKYNQQRVLIVDFDIHHGNATQNMFYQSKEVMYISIHRRDNGRFFPMNSPSDYTYDGHGMGQGFNINIPFNNDKMGDTEYIAAFQNIVLPAAYSFAPQMVLVSAGFDAGINDPLGGGYKVNPETFGHFIQMLKPLAEGRIIIALEGGYNLTTTAYGMAICTKVLLGDPVMMPKDIYKTFSLEACKTIQNVIKHFKRYYNVFSLYQRLALTPVLVKRMPFFTENSYDTELYKILDLEKVEDSDYVEEEMRKLNSGY